MRIVFNLRDQDWQTTKSLGILHVSLRLLTGLAERPDVERIDVLANRSLATQVESLPRCRLHYQNLATPRRGARLLWDHWSVVRACERLAPDWLLLPKGFSPLLRWPRARVSAYVHDNVFGYYERTGSRPFPRGEAWLFQRMLARTAQRADIVVTNSAFTAAEFARDFRPRRTTVPIGAPVSFHAPLSNGEVQASLLVPTSAWPHKLTPQALSWLERWADESRFHGKVHGYGSLPAATRWPEREGWRHHGRISDVALRQLETPTATLVYFSAYEGYGLPPVEAAAMGHRAIASDLPSLRETISAECLFDNDSYASFAQTLSRTLSSPAKPPLVIGTETEVAGRWVAALRGQTAFGMETGHANRHA